MNKATRLKLNVMLPRGVSKQKARAAVRKQFGCSLGNAVRNLIADALPAK